MSKAKNQSAIYHNDYLPTGTSSRNELRKSLNNECCFIGRNDDCSESESLSVPQIEYKFSDEERNPYINNKSCQTQTDENISEHRTTSANVSKKDFTSDNGSCSTFSYLSLNEEETIKNSVQKVVDAVMLVKNINTSIEQSNNATSSFQSFHDDDQQDLPYSQVKRILGANGWDNVYTFDDIMFLKQKIDFYHSISVLNKLICLERAVLQNIFRKKQIQYRNIPHAPAIVKSNDANDHKSILIEYLLSFKCSLLEDRTVTSMCWHSISKDILAVGYSGSKKNKFDKCGFVMLWSIRNPIYPEKMFETKSPVTSLSFALLSPTILAVGMDDGSISLHDTSPKPGQCSKSPLLNTLGISGRHIEPVTHLQWIVGKQQSICAEKLISLSIDGRVLQWSIKKGMCLQQLIVLKCQAASGFHGEQPKSSYPLMGLCIDFQKESNSMIYIVGCEDGSLFLCSRSYTERPIVIVKAHSSAITSVKFSPLNSNMFASSSSDSTIKVWKCNQRKDNISIVYTLQHQHDFWTPINDIAWSPKVATMLIAVTGDGKIDVWDVSKSVMDPVKSLQESTETEWANLLFEKDGNAIVVSDDQGDLKVFHLRH